MPSAVDRRSSTKTSAMLRGADAGFEYGAKLLEELTQSLFAAIRRLFSKPSGFSWSSPKVEAILGNERVYLWLEAKKSPFGHPVSLTVYMSHTRRSQGAQVIHLVIGNEPHSVLRMKIDIITNVDKASILIPKIVALLKNVP